MFCWPPNENDERPKPGFWDKFHNDFQLWYIKNPGKANLLQRWFFNTVSFLQLGLKGADGGFQFDLMVKFDGNFVFGGAVYVTDYESIEKALLLPQARGVQLAGVPLDPKRVPYRENDKDRFLSLIVLSQQGAGGNGDWEGLRAATDEYCTNTKEAYARQNDVTAKKLLASCAASYKKYGQTKDFFDTTDKGLRDFLIRYLHYVIFGLDPFDEETMGPIIKFHYGTTSASYFIDPIGKIFECTQFRDWQKQYARVAEIYKQSPAVQSFPEGTAKYSYLTKDEFARGMVSAMAIAALVGPWDYMQFTLGFWPLHDTSILGEERDTSKIDVTKVWDTLDLTNRVECLKYMMECGRLRQPVRKAPRLVTEQESPFTVKIQGEEHTFPIGTTILVPMQFAMVDETVWGPTAFEFDHNRPGLAEKFMSFNSVGDRTNGRICPGRNIAFKMITDLIVELGKVRREPDFNPQGAVAAVNKGKFL